MEDPNPTPTTLGLQASFGFGDRIGLATEGHIESMRQCGEGIAPIFAQQSIREMTRTGRSPRKVMEDALDAVTKARWKNPFGADADHLKTPEDIDRTADAGFTFFTIDPSDEVDDRAGSYTNLELRERFQTVQGQSPWFDEYLGRRVELENGTTIEFDEQAIMRTVVKYGRALNRALKLADHISQAAQRLNRDYEIELSVDETEQPTTLAEHYIIAKQCLDHDMKLVSLAPRFIGELEKGVDYIGDVDALERSLEDHAAIALRLGPYKLSLHSGSDKLSMYAALARASQGRFHVKTAGTSYLEALRVVAIHDTALFRRLCEFARSRYETDRATYHVHATLDTVPPPEQIAGDHQLQAIYLGNWDETPAETGFAQPGRQILHCTFGSTLTHTEWGPAIRECLLEHPKTYADVLAVHFGKHLQALQAGM